MKKYYVTVMYNDDERVALKTDDINEAIERARDEAYYIKRDKVKNTSVEIRVYTNDIEDDECTCFDYNLVEF